MKRKSLRNSKNKKRFKINFMKKNQGYRISILKRLVWRNQKIKRNLKVKVDWASGIRKIKSIKWSRTWILNCRFTKKKWNF